MNLDFIISAIAIQMKSYRDTIFTEVALICDIIIVSQNVANNAFIILEEDMILPYD